MCDRRGFSLIELVVTISVIGILSAVAAPVLGTVAGRNKAAVGERMVVDHLRAARMKAVSRNARVRVVFDCPTPGAMRTLVVTGNAAIDNAADRCRANQPNDGPAIWLPTDVSVVNGRAIEFDGRGVATPIGASAPISLRVIHGVTQRTVVVTGAGRVSGS